MPDANVRQMSEEFDELSLTVRVVCRFRPTNEREKREEAECVKDARIEFPDNKSVVVTKAGQAKPAVFSFDCVFYGDATQEEVFDVAIRDTIDDVTQGYNGTIFAYGQTGAGKSFSMFGPENRWTKDEKLRGIVPRACSRIFKYINDHAGDGREFTIKCSFMEIYMEKVKDLLNPKNTKLQIRDDKVRGVYVEGLTELFVTCEQDVYDLIMLGDEMRSKAATKMNANSSRSHTLFVLQLHQKFPDGSTKSGRLNLADLAGSESVGKTEATGQTLEEAKLINKSLVVLGRCIKALSERQKVVPFRESKLTFLLKDSLGGNSKTTLLIACSPSIWNVDETLSTLRFGASAKEIKNKVRINQQRSVAELEAIIANLEKEITKLKKLNARFESELLALNPNIDIIAIRKAVLSTLSASEDDDSAQRTPSKQSMGSAPSTPTRSDSEVGFASAPGSPARHIEEVELAELKVQLERKIQEKEYRIQDLEEELAAAKAMVSENGQTLPELKQQLEELLAEKTKIEFELSQKNIELETYKTSSTSLQERIDELERSLAEQVDQAHALQTAKDTLTRDLENAKRTADELSSHVRSLEATISQVIQEKEAMANRLSEAERQEQALEKRISELEQQHEMYAQQLREAQLNYKLAKQEREVVETALASARQKIQHLEFQLETESRTTTSQERVEVRIEHVERHNDQLVQRLEELQDENAMLSKKAATLESEIEKLRSDLRLKDQALATERAKAKAASDKVKSLGTQTHEMKLAHQTTKFQLEMKLKELELKFLTEQNQRLTAETQLQRVKREMEDRDTKISHYANTVAKLQRELREERTKSALASKQNAEYSKRIKELETALAQLRLESRSTQSEDVETPAETLLKRQQMRRRPSAASIFRPVVAVPVGYSISDYLDATKQETEKKEKKGWLMLQEGSIWCRRWCVVKNGILQAYMTSSTEGAPVDQIELKAASILRADGQTGKTNSFSIATKTSTRFAVASSEDDLDEWLSWLSHAGCKVVE